MTHERQGTPKEVQEGMEILEKQRPLNVTNIKKSCQFELQRFINMRGTIDRKTGEIHLHPMTVFEQNIVLTIQKMKEANQLISNLETANSVEEISDTLKETPTSQPSTASLREDLDAVIGKCLVLTEIAKRSA